MKPAEFGRVPRRGAAMWSAIAASAALLVGLLAAGWGQWAWRTAAGALLLSCLGVCVWAALMGERTCREVQRAAGRLAAERRTQRDHP